MAAAGIRHPSSRGREVSQRSTLTGRARGAKDLLLWGTEPGLGEVTASGLRFGA